ncbi:MAG TPA: hypothetical protein VIW47_02885 [Nitrospiraceae bacterium]
MNLGLRTSNLEPRTLRCRDPEGEDGVDAVRLGLEGVGVEGGTIVLDIEVVQPVQVVMHEAGSESDCAPVLEMLVDSPCFFSKFRAAAVEFAVVVQVVDAHFESVALKFFDQVPGNLVIAFGDEIEGGAEAQVHFELHQLPASIQTSLAFHIVRQHKGELFAVGPAGPAFRGSLRAGQDGPGLRHSRPFPQRKPAANGEPGGRGQERLEVVIEAVAEHGVN